ncbi:hypothetical protein A9Z60_05930 [Moraxella nonliquefaciens]|uniref:Uncharacterized protein n=1 Tax=Moraxella nonliquefaciens TaxID=478 RepID=A0A1B8PL12_MORNO|nr:hypothetical protein A9Z60_05930 [Moraxella nonliquefaciens]
MYILNLVKNNKINITIPINLSKHWLIIYNHLIYQMPIKTVIKKRQYFVMSLLCFCYKIKNSRLRQPQMMS